MIVSFSGIDSSGKSTQLDLLSRYFSSQKIRYKYIWSKARGTPGVVFLKSLVRRDRKLSAEEKKEYRDNYFKNQKKEKFLYVVSMLDLFWYWGIYFRLLNLIYQYVLCDRYIWDTFIELQHDFPHIDTERSILWKVVHWIAAKPKVSFCFFVPAEVSLQRDLQKNAAGVEDIVRKKSKIALYQKCAEHACWTRIMDGLMPIDVLHQQVLQALQLD